MSSDNNVPDQPRSGVQFTVAPVAASVVTIAAEFCRMPRSGEIEPLSGLRRSQLYELTREGLIQTVSLRRRGKARGTRLIVAASLLSYLRGLAAEQNPADVAKNAG
ncbi:MAG TPA: hypothetical protein VHC95_13260 [Opitutales bacterium]|nr:hypothetical protein [Opitutales bacterium]